MGRKGIIDAADRAQGHRMEGLLRIHLDQMVWRPGNRNGQGISANHVHEIAAEILQHRPSAPRYRHVDVVEAPDYMKAEIFEANKKNYEGHPLLPKVSKEFKHVCVTKTHLAQKLDQDGSRCLFSKKVAIKWADDDCEGKTIAEQGSLCAVYKAVIWEDIEAAQALCRIDNQDARIMMEEREIEALSRVDQYFNDLDQKELQVFNMEVHLKNMESQGYGPFTRADATLLMREARNRSIWLSSERTCVPKLTGPAGRMWFEGWRHRYGISYKYKYQISDMQLKVPYQNVKKRVERFLCNICCLRTLWEECHPGVPMNFLSLDQKPAWWNNAGYKKTYAAEEGYKPFVQENCDHVKQRCTILPSVTSWSHEAAGSEMPVQGLPKLAALFRGSPNGEIIKNLEKSLTLTPYLKVQVQRNRSYRSADLVQALDWFLPTATRPEDSIVVILDWYSGHLTDEVAAVIRRKGHVLIFHGGGCTPFLQVNDSTTRTCTHSSGPNPLRWKTLGDVVKFRRTYTSHRKQIARLVFPSRKRHGYIKRQCKRRTKSLPWKRSDYAVTGTDQTRGGVPRFAHGHGELGYTRRVFCHQHRHAG